MKFLISVSCVLVMGLLNPCQGKAVTEEHQDDSGPTKTLSTTQVIREEELKKVIPDEVEIEREIEIDLEEAAEEDIYNIGEKLISDEIKEIMQEADNIFKETDDESVKVPIDEVEIEKEMEKEIGIEIDLEEAAEEQMFKDIGKELISDEIKEIMREADSIFKEMDDERVKEPTGVLPLGSVWIIEVIIGGYQNNSNNVVNGNKGGDEHLTSSATVTPMIDMVTKGDYKDTSISMLYDDKIADDNSNIPTPDQKEQNATITDKSESELEKENEIEIEIELDLEEAFEEEINEEYEEMFSDEIKEILQDEDTSIHETDNGHVNDPKGDIGPNLSGWGLISDSRSMSSVISDDEDHEGSGTEEQNKTIADDSESINEVENEIALEEENAEINEEIESMKMEGMNSEIKNLEEEEDNIMEEMDILENSILTKNEAPAVHSANYATPEHRDQAPYSHSTMRLVFFISAGTLMLSVLLLLIILIVILTKKETEHGNPATRYVKRIRLISNTSTKSKEFLI